MYIVTHVPFTVNRSGFVSNEFTFIMSENEKVEMRLAYFVCHVMQIHRTSETMGEIRKLGN